jgi:hypothetical protein
LYSIQFVKFRVALLFMVLFFILKNQMHHFLVIESKTLVLNSKRKLQFKNSSMFFYLIVLIKKHIQILWLLHYPKIAKCSILGSFSIMYSSARCRACMNYSEFPSILNERYAHSTHIGNGVFIFIWARGLLF